MGEVWLAEAAGAAGFSKRVVIKTLRPELTADPRLVDQFVAEGQLLEQLDHPNIAQILDLGHANDTWFLAMEYVEGFDLRALLRAGPSDGIGEIATVCVLASAARALEHAGTRRGQDGEPLAIVHHDVTPSNLMVRRDGHVKLVDFGVARSAIRAHLEPGALRGKLPYLAPEQVRAPETVDARADLFALGLVAVELLSGQRAMQVADPAGLEVAWASLPQRVARLCAGTHPDTVALIAQMTALDPADRPADAAAASGAIHLRLAALSVSDTDRPVAQHLQAAFTRLEAEASGFSHTLGALVAAGRQATEQPSLGTVSLPGLADFGRPIVAPAPALSPAFEFPASNASSPATPLRVGATPEPRVLPEPDDAAAPDRAATLTRASAPFGLKRRVWLALLVLLGLATTVGWWLGGRDQSDRVAAAPVTPTAASPAAVSPAATPLAVVSPPAAASPTVAVSPGRDATTSAAGGRAIAAAAPTVAAAADVGIQRASAASATLSGSVTQAAVAVLPRPSKPVSSRPSTRREASHARKGDRQRPARGQLIFRVLPVDAEVRVDGQPSATRPTNGVYRLNLTVGDHTIEVRDPASGKRQQRVEAVFRGVKRRVSGFTLVRTLP